MSVGEAKPMQQIRTAQQNSEPGTAWQACNYSCQMTLSHPNHLSVFPWLVALSSSVLTHFLTQVQFTNSVDLNVTG